VCDEDRGVCTPGEPTDGEEAPGVSFEGGGCDCRMARGRDQSPLRSLSWLAAGVVLIWRRRRAMRR